MKTKLKSDQVYTFFTITDMVDNIHYCTFILASAPSSRVMEKSSLT